MRRKRHATARLRHAIHSLPASTRQAMLEALGAQQIIVGDYSSRSGGACPMLAAHRRGGRGDFMGFGRAWDSFAAARRPRPATPRELEILTALLQESIPGPARPDAAPQPGDWRPGEPSVMGDRVVVTPFSA